jgi:diguanylate cyclase (GGDEF)-like protein
MAVFEESIERAIATEGRTGRVRADKAEVVPRLPVLLSIAAKNSPVGLAVVMSGKIRWANDAFGDAVSDLAGEIADHASLLRAGQPSSLAALLDVLPSDSRSEVLLYGETMGGITVVASVASPAHSSASGGASHLDAITGLPDRAELEDALSREFGDQTIAMMLVDVDGFGELTSRHGHHAGDEILREVARRLLSASRASEVVYRYGRDEFVILARDLNAANEECGSRMSERLVRAVSSTPIMLGDDEIFVTINAGLAHGVTGAEAGAILEQVEAAMSETLPSGGNRSVMFMSQVCDGLAADQRMVREIDRAIRASSFELLYQPIVALDSGETVGHEALLRLVLRDDQVLAPGQFLDHAKDAGMMDAIDEWVLARAIEDLAHSRSSTPLGMSINISESIFESNTLPQYVEGLIARLEVDPELLVLEFTELAILSDQAHVGAQLKLLAGLGVRIALDDFGTGYSSLTHLSHLHIDIIKLDKRFVNHVDMEGAANSVARVVVAVGNALGCDVVAEGIERNEERVALLELGCRYGQGFYYGHPAPLPLHTPRA